MDLSRNPCDPKAYRIRRTSRSIHKAALKIGGGSTTIQLFNHQQSFRIKLRVDSVLQESPQKVGCEMPRT